MRKFLLQWGCLFSLLAISFSSKADAPVLAVYQIADLKADVKDLSTEELADKLASDARFKELVDLELSFRSKFRSLSVEDKKSFMKSLDNKDVAAMLKLFTKCGIDYKVYAAKKISLFNALDKEFTLNKRADKATALKSAASKLTPDFAECLAYWATNSALCNELYAGDDDALLLCFSIVTSVYLACIAALP